MSDSTIRWDKDADGVVILTLDDPNQSANTMNEAYKASMAATVERLEAEKDDITGVIITSAKKTFFAGGDLNDLKRAKREDAAEVATMVRELKGQLRRLETLGKPVVAAINGAALGGGLEIALAAHYRIAVDDPSVVLGFPEVQLGLLPGGGGVTRSVRMFGIADALLQLLLQGQRHRPAKALEMGLVGELVPSREDLIPAAKKWIAANPEAVQPWDVKGHKIPGGTPSNPKFAANLPAFPANLRKQIKGANYPAPHHIMAAAVEGSQVDFDTAIEIEGRYFTDLVTGQVAKNMIQAFFFDLNAVGGKRGRPDDLEPTQVKKVVVLGAGMMGAAIAYVCAKAGIEVVLKDVDQAAADKGKDYSVKLVEKGVARGKTTQEKGDKLLSLITATTDASAAAGADLVIEAVFEDPKVKAEVMAEIEPHLAEDALLGSNTSTLPITSLAENVSRPADFIGLHFFSPVDKMPLLEIIKGEKTSDAALYRALDLAKQIKKTPIVVNDSRGFFTSRVIGTFLNEGMSMLGEGVPPASIEQASSAGRLPGPAAAALRRAEHEADAADPQRLQGRDRGRGRHLDAAPRRGRDRPHGRRVRAPRQARGRRLLRVRRRQAHAAVAGPARGVPARRGPERDLTPGPAGADALHRGDRDRQVRRRGRHRVDRRRQHRLDHGHRLPRLDRRSPAVHQRLRRRRPGLRGPRA